LPSFVYPLAVFLARKVLLKFVPLVILSDDATDIAGLVVMFLEIIASAPQFYVLTRHVESLTSPGVAAACAAAKQARRRDTDPENHVRISARHAHASPTVRRKQTTRQDFHPIPRLHLACLITEAAGAFALARAYHTEFG
jgi:hypothetical protein